MVRLKVCASATGLLVSPIVLADTIKTLPGPPTAILLFLHRLALGLHVLECDSRPILECWGSELGVCEIGNRTLDGERWRWTPIWRPLPANARADFGNASKTAPTATAEEFVSISALSLG